MNQELDEFDVVDIKILNVENNKFLNYAITYRNGQEKICRLKLKWCISWYNKNNIVDVEHFGYVPVGFIKYDHFHIFVITYVDGHKELLCVKEEKTACKELLLLSEKSREGTLNKSTYNPDSIDTEVLGNGYILKKNELPQGNYLIGRDIPAGVYDFFVVYGHSGRLDVAKYDENGDIINGTWDAYYWIGLKEDYEHREIIHVNCRNGYTVKIEGNVIVKIAKSQKVNIEL